MRGRLTRLRSGAWLRRQRALFVPCLAMIAMACIAGFLTGAVPSGRPLGVEVVRFAVAALLASAVAFTVLIITGWAVGGKVVRRWHSTQRSDAARQCDPVAHTQSAAGRLGLGRLLFHPHLDPHRWKLDRLAVQ